jgi:hypothetical protein
MTSFIGFDFPPRIVPRPAETAEPQPSTPSARYAAFWAPMPRRSVHLWTIEEQAILCVLERWLISEKPVGQRLLSFRDIRRTFSAYFADTVRFHGEADEITNNAVAAQIYEIKKEREQNVAWREVFLETDFLDPLNEWAATKHELVATASLIGIVLLKRPFEDKAIVFKEILSPGGAKRKRVHQFRPWTNDEKPPGIYKRCTFYGLLTPGTPKRAKLDNNDTSPLARKGGKASGTLALPQTWPFTAPPESAIGDSGSLHVPQRFLPTPEASPRKGRVKWAKRGIRRLNDQNDILFRYWDSNSQGINTPDGFLAGAYIGRDLDSSLPTVPNLLSEEFLIPAEPHLLRKHEATPFISVYSKAPAISIHSFVD